MKSNCVLCLTYVFLLCTTFINSALANTSKVFRLSEFHAGDSTVRLESSIASQTLGLPLSESVEVVSASININAVNSIALLENRSVLNVRFNNATIEQIPLGPQTPSINTTITVPKVLWRPGFNNLTFKVSQHYTDMCENPDAPELWSEIDLYRSSLTLETRQTDKDLKLSDLSSYFSPGIGGQRTVDIVSVDGDHADVVTHVMPVVTQGLALRNQYQPLMVNTKKIHAQDERLLDILSKADQPELIQSDALTKHLFYLENLPTKSISVLLGTKEALSDFLSDSQLDKITSSFLGIEYVAPYISEGTVLTPAGHRLVVSGTSIEELKKAAKALAIMDDELNPDAHTNFLSMSNMNTNDFVNSRVMLGEGIYRFEDIGTSSSYFRGKGEFFKQVILPFAADFYAAESSTVQILLDFAYGAGLGQASVMNILVNGKLVHGLNLDNPNGNSYLDYRLDVPARYFKAGNNSLEFYIKLRSPDSDQICNDIEGAHLLLQLHSSSSIELPEVGKVGKQPDLALFADTSFPFTYASTARPAVVYYTEESMLSSALTLIGKMSQSLKTLNPAFKVEQGIPSQLAPNAIILSTPQDLSQRLYDELELAIAASKRFSYQLQNQLQQQVQGLIKREPKEINQRYHVLQQSTLGGLGIALMQKNQNTSMNGTSLIISAENSDLLAQRIEDLISLSLWGQLKGNFFVWQDDKKPKIAMRVSRNFELGDGTSPWFEYRMWLSNNPWYWIAAVLVLVLLGTWSAYIMLKRRNREIEKTW